MTRVEPRVLLYIRKEATDLNSSFRRVKTMT